MRSFRSDFVGIRSSLLSELDVLLVSFIITMKVSVTMQLLIIK